MIFITNIVIVKLGTFMYVYMDLELNIEIFNCQECHYNTSPKSQWTRSIKTNKH